MIADQPLAVESLDRLLRPRKLALVGASDKNLFSRRAFAQHKRVGGDRRLGLVNPRSRTVHGAETVASCTDLPGGIDCAFLMTPQRTTAAALEDAAAAGARAAVILSQGWAEEGASGLRRQQELVAQAEELGVVLLGPNHLGFANLWDGVAACALGLDLPVEPGSFALVSQSGAVGSSMVGYAARQDVRFSFVVTTGNEAMVTVADAVHYLVDDERTRAIGIFAETIRKPAVFRAAAARAAELGKALVILKAGTSELAARTAAAHTGALVGDDRVIDAVLRQDGVIRVRSVEDLICTGTLCASVGPVRAPGVGILSVSGGACDLIADRGEDVGLVLPSLSEQTNARLAQILPPYGHPQNPLDVTGGALADPEVWRQGITAMAAEPDIGLIGVVTSLPTAGEEQRDDTFHAVGSTLATVGLPGAVFPQIDQVQSDYVRKVKSESGVHVVLPSVERFVHAAAGLTTWSKWLNAHTAPPARTTRVEPAVPVIGPMLSEHAGRALLQQFGVPLIPAELITDATAAVAAAARFGGPVAMKICSAEVAHKTELGGVELKVEGSDAVAAAYERLITSASAAGVALEGVLVSPMRSSGVELLVGVTADPSWGQVLAVAFGGALVELLDDTALRVLPVGRDDVRSMLAELRGYRLLTGFRGSKPADIDRLTEVILAVADLAVSLPAFDSVEINPLLIDGERIEALDVLITSTP
ncbi:acetate--CoA ligase family protein [Amycolatopsis acidiphila]|uniref:Acetate--CoA ligase family protein n=1 Tax=Amycolatopsis acidiphila TaxID=715473 RepID=A0A558A133_9PSEU|nr:acetate--CoA ligase family protein [Amycolatopsis acidiphila]